jgi:hypothetical protein
MVKHRWLVAAVLTAVLVSACSGSYEVKSNAPIPTARYKTAYIVDSQHSSIIGYNVIPLPGSVMMTDSEAEKGEAVGDTPIHIQRALGTYGIRAVIGSSESIPADIDLVVVYEDAWQWDFKMYLKALKIDMFDNHTKELIGSGSYTAGGGGFHDYPTSEREAPIIIDRILRGN